MRWLGVVAIGMAACGGGGGDGGADATATPDAEGCAIQPLPEGEPLTDPLAMPLPDDCVAGGANQMIGRWFTESDDHIWSESLIRFDAACGGLREHLVPLSETTDQGRHDSWFDGTRFFVRDETDFGPDSRRINAIAACALPTGELATVRALASVRPGDPVVPVFLPVSHGPHFDIRDAPAAGMTLVGALASRTDGTAIEAFNLVVQGTHAYVAGANGFDVIDIADPAQPAVVGHVDGYCNDVRVVIGGGHTVAFLADDTTRLIDVTDPAAPVAFAELGTSAHSLQVVDTGGSRLLFVADGYSPAIPVFDVTDPSVPSPVTTITVSADFNDGVHDLFVDAGNDLLYANATFGGTIAFDTSAGYDAIVELTRFHSGDSEYSHGSWAGTIAGRRIVLTADEGWSGTIEGAAFLHVLDGDPASPAFMTEIGRYQSRREVGIHYFEVAGDKVYIAYYQDGARVVDLADPTHPVEVAHYNTWDDEATGSRDYYSGAFSIRAANGLVYVADAKRGLVILRED